MSKDNSSRFFSTRLGLILATVGSAVGLGTIWRFPAEVQSGGGSAFLFVYIICVFLLGVPVMLCEFTIGRAGGADAITSYRRLSPKTKWWIVGATGVLTSFLIGIFYMVVAGWTLTYLVESVTGSLYQGISHSDEAMVQGFSTKMQHYITTDWTPLIFTLIVVTINILILLGGVKKGIERMANIAMPMLFIILLLFMVVVLLQPGASEGVKYFLSPDFSKITPRVVISALGQALFSLSVGMGILVTYAAYYPPQTNLPKTSVTVSSLTLLIAIMMGLIIFPAVTAFGITDHGMAGTTLVFVTLPEVFAQLPGCRFWSILFFTLLLLAALTSTVSIVEPSIAFVRDHFRASRKKATLVVMLPILILSGICSLSFGCLKKFTVAGMNMFESLDALTNYILLPLVAIGGCLFVGWFAPKNLLHDQLTNYGTLRAPFTSFITIILRYLAPLSILLIMFFAFLSY